MNCDEARLLIGAEPEGSSPALEEHVRGCAACSGFRDEMRRLEGNIRHALERGPVGAPARTRAAGRTRFATWRQWALAAGAALATFLVLGVWLLRPSDTLAHDVVAHVQAEPESWLAKEGVSAQGIGQALSGAGVALDLTSDRITYAQSCWFHGHYVPHLVVQTTQGPATVMILRHEQVRSRRDFHEGGMSGVIVPTGHGSLAIVTRGANSPGELAGQIEHEMHWMPPSR